MKAVESHSFGLLRRRQKNQGNPSVKVILIARSPREEWSSLESAVSFFVMSHWFGVVACTPLKARKVQIRLGAKENADRS